MTRSTRRSVEARSVAILRALDRFPRWAVFVPVIALVVGGLTLHGVPGAVLLYVVALLLGWLGYLAWPALTPGSRALRLATVLLVVGAATARLRS